MPKICLSSIPLINIDNIFPKRNSNKVRLFGISILKDTYYTKKSYFYYLMLSYIIRICNKNSAKNNKGEEIYDE